MVKIDFKGALKRKPEWPKQITLKQEGVCWACCCDYNKRMEAGEQAMWSGPNTGMIRHLVCPDPCSEYAPHGYGCTSCEIAYLEYEAACGDKDWFFGV